MRGVLPYCALLVAVVALFAFFHSSMFRLQVVEIRGIERLEGEEIKVIAGLSGGQHLYSFSIGGIRERLLEDPRVAEVQARRRLPGALVIEVTERRPVAVMAQGGVFAQVDPGGLVLSVHESWPGVELPVLSGVEVEEMPLGSRLSSAGLDELLYCADKLGTIRSCISEIERARGFLRLYTTEGATILFPASPEELETAVSVLSDILAELSPEAECTVDLRVPARPVLRCP